MAQFPQHLPPQFVISGGAAANGTDAQREAAVLSFEPDAAVQAIVFHMLDEGLAREVVRESMDRTVARLHRRELRPSIRRSEWELMSNHDRLEWLLSESRVVPLKKPENDVVTLEARDAR